MKIKKEKISFENIKQRTKHILLNYPEIYLIPIFILVFTILLAIATGGFDASKARDGGYKKEIFKVHWYAIFIMTGIIFAVIISLKEMKKLHINVDDILTGIIIIVPSSIVGARLYYVITSPHKFNTFLEAIAIWQGGLAITGAIITAFLLAILITRWKKIPLLYIIDVIAIGFLIGQIIGRWGNFINQEAHGVISSNELRNFPAFIKYQMFFTDLNAHGISSTTPQYWQPTFFYESSLNFIALLVFLVIRRFRLLKAGDLFGFYLIWYGLLRGLVIEPLRQDPLLVFGYKVNVLFSIFGLSLTGIVYLVLKNCLFPKLPYYKDISKGNDQTYKLIYSSKKGKNKYQTKKLLVSIDTLLENDINIYSLKRLEKSLSKLKIDLKYIVKKDLIEYDKYKIIKQNYLIYDKINVNNFDKSTILVSDDLNLLTRFKTIGIPTLILGIYKNYTDLLKLDNLYNCVNIEDIIDIIKERG